MEQFVDTINGHMFLENLNLFNLFIIKNSGHVTIKERKKCHVTINTHNVEA